MFERLKQLFPDNRDVVFCNQGGELVRVSLDKNTRTENLIRERESLGERVIAITSSSEAKKLIESQQAERMRGLTNELHPLSIS